MTATADIEARVAELLSAIGGLTVYTGGTDSINELPAALVRVRGANYSDGTFKVSVLLLAASSDSGEAERRLSPFLATSGASSVKAAIEQDAGYLAVDFSGFDSHRAGGMEYRGVDIRVVAAV